MAEPGLVAHRADVLRTLSDQRPGIQAQGKGTDRNWAESSRDQWFDEAHGPNAVVALLTEVGGSTRSVTAFDRSALVESGAGVP